LSKSQTCRSFCRELKYSTKMLLVAPSPPPPPHRPAPRTGGEDGRVSCIHSRTSRHPLFSLNSTALVGYRSPQKKPYSPKLRLRNCNLHLTSCSAATITLLRRKNWTALSLLRLSFLFGSRWDKCMHMMACFMSLAGVQTCKKDLSTPVWADKKPSTCISSKSPSPSKRQISSSFC